MRTHDELHMRVRRVQLAIAGAATAAVLIVGVRIVPGLIWRGVAVVEPCDRKAQDRFGDDVSIVRGEERISWWPPGWECRLTNGETIRR